MRYKTWLHRDGRRHYLGAYQSLASLHRALACRELTDGCQIEIQVVDLR